LLLSGYHIPNNEIITNSTKSSILIVEPNANAGLEDCPYSKGKDEISCPFLEGKINDANSSCPYSNGEYECQYLGKQTQPGACPYQNKDLNKQSETKKIYKSLKNTST
jgi:hypothetical protein